MLIAPAVALGLIGVLGVAPALAQARTFTSHVQVPISTSVFVPCAAGGAGEVVDLSGTRHVLFHITRDDRNWFHLTFHFLEGVSGTGQTTGDTYQGTRVAQDTIYLRWGGEETILDYSKIIGQGPGNNFLLRMIFHVTVSANGEVTAFVDNFSAECR